jgi:hypothetical protein
MARFTTALAVALLAVLGSSLGAKMNGFNFLNVRVARGWLARLDVVVTVAVGIAGPMEPRQVLVQPSGAELQRAAATNQQVCLAVLRRAWRRWSVCAWRGDRCRGRSGCSNYIALTFCWYQETVDTPGPIYVRNGTTPTDDELTAIVQLAHSQGVSVLFRPCVDPGTVPWADRILARRWRQTGGRARALIECRMILLSPLRRLDEPQRCWDVARHDWQVNTFTPRGMCKCGAPLPFNHRHVPAPC